MLNDLRHTARHVIIYSIGNLSAKLVGFILLPMYTELLSPEEYGIAAILELTGFLVASLAGLKFSTAMMRWSAAEKDRERIRIIAFTTLFALLLVVGLTNLILQPLAGSFSRILFENSDFTRYFHILFLSVSFEILNMWVLDLIRIREKPTVYVILTLVRFTVILLLNIYLIRFRGMGVIGIFISQLAGGMAMLVLATNFIRKNIRLKIDWSLIRPMARYGFPLVFSTISMYLLTLGDRYIMKYLLDLGQVGVYALGYKIATVSNLVIIQSFQTGFLPIAYQKYDEGGNERFFSKTLTYYVLILVLFSLTIALFSKEIVLLLARTNGYYDAWKVVPFISLAFVFRGIQYVMSLSLHFVKKTRYNATIVMTMAVVNLGLNFLLQPRLGIYGAALSGLISYFIMLNIFRFYAMRFYNPGYENGKIMLMIVLAAGLFVLSLTFNKLDIVLSILLKSALIISFPFLLLPFGFYEKIEKERIHGAWLKWRSPLKWKRNIAEFFGGEGSGNQ